MAEQEAAGKKGKVGAWIKGISSALLGLVSGAVLMYLSPLVDRVVKPARPVANFAIALQGAQVTFQDHSTGGAQGWWDFGDGSPLEPYLPGQPSVTHSYPRPGAYTAKLSLQNLLNDQSERTVNVQIDGPAPGPVAIDTFQVVSTRADTFAPATFRVVSQVKNAELCIWWGDTDRPTEVQPRPPADEQDRFYTFKEPGKHVIKLIAVQGQQVIERTQTVEVAQPRAGVPMAVLNITRDACRLETAEQRRNVQVAFPEKYTSNTYHFSQELPAGAGWQVTSAELGAAAKDSTLNDVKVTVALDGSKAVLTGQLVKKTGFLVKRLTTPRAVVEVVLKLQRRCNAACPPTETVAMPLNLSGPTILTIPGLPCCWLERQCHLTLDVLEGKATSVLKGAAVPVNGVVMLGDRPFRLTATEVGNKVQINLRELSPGQPLRGN
jgi:hypothetical protein